MRRYPHVSLPLSGEGRLLTAGGDSSCAMISSVCFIVGVMIADAIAKNSCSFAPSAKLQRFKYEFAGEPQTIQ